MTFEQAKSVDARQGTPASISDQNLGLSTEAKVAFINAALTEKKEQIRELASQRQFCPERASQALETLSDIITKLPEKSRGMFVDAVAMPLMAHESLDVLKFMLTSRSMANLHSSVSRDSGSLINILVEKGVERVKNDILKGRVEEAAQGEMLPLPSRAIVYFLEPTTEVIRDAIQDRVKGMSELLRTVQERGICSSDLLESTSSLHIDIKANGQSHYAGVVVAGYLQLVIEPQFSLADLATTLVHEDLHLLFEKKYGDGSDDCVVDDIALSKPIRGSVPLVAENNRLPEGLLSEFHSYVKELDFKQHLVEQNLMPVKEVLRFWSESKELAKDLDKGLTILRKCEKRGDFTEAGSSLIQELDDLLADTKERIVTHMPKMLSALLKRQITGEKNEE